MSRRDIYYWKCDRPAAFHGTQDRAASHGAEVARAIEPQLIDELRRCFATRDVVLSPGVGQGTHLTWNAEIDGSSGRGGRAMFVRVENGPERDGQLALESTVLDRVRESGVRTPLVYGCDASRSRVPFAWQALERVDAPDLNKWFKQGALDVERIPFAIGAAVATWQGIEPAGFGVLDVSRLGSDERLVGYHASYYDYFRLRLDDHLTFLVERGFLTQSQSTEIQRDIFLAKKLLKLPRGCLVHKDLALWNILGSQAEIAAFIDFDDAISGDPMDDLSLLACFHDAAFVAQAFAGYESVRPLPADHRRRFWLHLLRNMIVKSVIRVGAGYFDRTDGFFLIGSGTSGADLKRFTLDRLELALRGLRTDAEPNLLDAADL
jgi:fructosamine-3-kinase